MRKCSTIANPLPPSSSTRSSPPPTQAKQQLSNKRTVNTTHSKTVDLHSAVSKPMEEEKRTTQAVVSTHKNERNKWFLQENLRVVVSYLYHSQFHESYLNGSAHLQTGDGDGIIVQVSKILKLDRSHYNMVKKVITDTITALSLGDAYEPERVTYICPDRRKVKADSAAMHLLTCFKEKGLSYRLTSDVYNACVSEPQGLQPILYSAVHGAISKSNHKISQTQKRHQASARNLIWRQARFNSCAQLLVRFGLPMPRDTKGAVVSDPEAININNITNNNLTLSLDQIGWWDEKHISQVVGCISDTNYHFGRDADGVYDHDADFEVEHKVSKRICDENNEIIKKHSIFLPFFLFIIFLVPKRP